MKRKKPSLKPRVVINMNLSTRRHKTPKGIGSYSRKTKFQKPLDNGE